MQTVSSSCVEVRHARHAMAYLESGTILMESDSTGAQRLILPSAPDVPLLCHLRGHDFHCSADIREPVPSGRDATVVTMLTASGRFTSPGSLAGTMDVMVGCEGLYCYGLRLTGCSLEKTFEATLEQ